MSLTRAHCLALDAADPLAPLRNLFSLPDGVIYLDGNSLGALPAASLGRLTDTITSQWGVGLIRSWNDAGWMSLSADVGDKIATLIGVGPGQVVVADSTSVNLYKVLTFAAQLTRLSSPSRTRMVTERGNFPTDVYVAQSVAAAHAMTLHDVEPADLVDTFDHSTAIVILTHVNYRTGAMHDMAQITAAAHRSGALVIWDLSHSTGAVPVDLTAANADFAVGCGYKFLNGGPGAPAFVWVHPRHVNAPVPQPLPGWLGHRAPFEFSADYTPALGISRFLCGTPPLLSLVALDTGVDTLLAARPYGAMAALHDKALALTTLFGDLVHQRTAGHGLLVITPVGSRQRGSQISFEVSPGAYAIVQALVARGVIGDYREPDVMRFGVAPLYTRYVDIWDAVEHLVQVLTSGEWRNATFSTRPAVT